MIMCNRFLIFLCFSLLLLGCNNSSIEEEYNYVDYFEKELRFHLDDSTSNEFIYTSLFKDKRGNFLVSLNPLTNSIDMYSFEASKLMKRIKYQTEGPKGTNYITQGFTFHSPDSIFIFLKGNVKGSIMINEEGDFLDRLTPSIDRSVNYGLINHVSSGGNPTIKFGHSLIFSRYPLFDTYNPSNINSSFPLGFHYNLENDELRFDSLFTYPELYLDKIWPIYDLVFSRITIKDSIDVISWPLLDSLVIIEKKTQNLKMVNGSSPDFQLIPKPYQIRPEKVDEVKNVLGQFRFKNILYDHYNNIYYRILRHPISDLEELNYFPDSYSQPFSVLVFDSKFNFIKQISFPGNLYSINSPMISEEGLVLLKNNYFDPELDEDFLDIHIFNLAK